MPVVTKHRKRHCLKTTKMYFCPILESRVQNQGISRVAFLLLEALRENLFPASCLVSTGCRWPLILLGLYMCYSYFRVGLHMTLPSVSMSCHFLSPTRTPVIGCRAHPNPGWSLLEILTLFSSAKTLIPSKVTYWDSEQIYFWGGAPPDPLRVCTHINGIVCM